MQPALKGVPEAKPAPRPDGLLVDNGEYYFNEFPPGQAVASLDLSSGDPLTDFLNNNRSTDGVDNSVSAPARARRGAAAGDSAPGGYAPGRRTSARASDAGPAGAGGAADPGAGRRRRRLGGSLGGGDGGNTPIPPIPVPRVQADPLGGARASAVNGVGPLAARPL